MLVKQLGYIPSDALDRFWESKLEILFSNVKEKMNFFMVLKNIKINFIQKKSHSFLIHFAIKLLLLTYWPLYLHFSFPHLNYKNLDRLRGRLILKKKNRFKSILLKLFILRINLLIHITLTKLLLLWNILRQYIYFYKSFNKKPLQLLIFHIPWFIVKQLDEKDLCLVQTLPTDWNVTFHSFLYFLDLS